MLGPSKIIILGFLICLCLAVGAPVSAVDVKPEEKGFQLEQRYPSLPIIGSLDDVNKLPQEERMGFYVKYFINLAFFIVVALCIAVLIVAGVAYVAASQKPGLVVAAKAMVKNAFLGLFILATAYLVLYTINPAILILPGGVPLPSLPAKILVPDYEEDQVVLVRAPFTAYMRRTLTGMAQKVYKDKDGNFIDENGYLTDGYGNYVDKAGNFLKQGESPVKGRLASNLLNNFFAKLVNDTSAASPSSEFVFQAEIPFLQIANILDEAIEVIEGDDSDDNPGLKKLLERCQCGDSEFHVDWSASASKEETTVGGKCTGGIDPKERKGHIDSKSDNKDIRKSQYNCLVQCDNCGTLPGEGTPPGEGTLDCDLREVKLTTTTIPGTEREVRIAEVEEREDTPDSWKAFEWYALDGEPLPGAWQPVKAIQDIAERARLQTHLIKYKRLQLLEIKAKLEGQKQRFFPELVGFLADALSTNKIDYVISQALFGSFGFDAQEKIEEIEKRGYEVVLQDFQESTESPAAVPGQSQQSSLTRILSWLFPFVKAVSSQQLFTGYFEPGDFFYIIHAPTEVQAEKVTKFNKEVDRNSKRINLFSVLTGLTLENIEGIYKGCLAAAFGQANYQINKEELQVILDESIDEGAAAHFSAELEGLAANMQTAMSGGMYKAVEDDVTYKFVGKHWTECKKANSCNTHDSFTNVPEEEKQKLIAALAEQGKCGSADACCQCIKQGLKKGIPPHFVSDTIAKVFTSDIENALPALRDFLDRDIRNILFEEEGAIDKFLDEDMLTLYNRILQGALTKSFAEMVPGLDDLLAEPIKDVLPRYVTQQLEDLNQLLECTIDGCCRTADKEGRRVETEDDCVGWEKFEEKQTAKGLQKQCCIEGAKKWIQRHSEDYVKEQVEQYVKQPLHNFVQGKVAAWGLSAEYLLVDQCYEQEWPRRIFNFEVVNIQNQGECLQPQGPFLKPKEIKGKCIKVTPEIVDKITSIQIPTGVEWEEVNGEKFVKKVLCETVGAPYKEQICRAAGYAWNCGVDIATGEEIETKVRTGQETEEELKAWDMSNTIFKKGFNKSDNCLCQEELFADIQAAKRAISTTEDLQKTGRKIVGGVINFGEQFALALIETTVHTAIEYAKVFIQDRVITPFASAFSKVTNFQKGLDAFLKKSVSQVLPSQVSETLQGNINQQIEDICLAYQRGEEANITATGESDRQTKIKFQLPRGVTWDGSDILEQEITIKKEVGDRLCRLGAHLDTTVLGELESLPGVGEQIKTRLKTKVNELVDEACKKLGKPNCADWLEKSVAEILWPGITGIVDLIKGTPRQVICGELMTFKNNKITVKIGADKSIFQRCQEIKKEQWGIMPSPDPAKLLGLSREEKDAVVPWCGFIYLACENPFLPLAQQAESTFKKPLGVVTETLFNTACQKAQIEAQNKGCEGDCWCKGCPDFEMEQQDESDCGIYKKACSGCSFASENTLAFTLVFQGVKEMFWLPRYDVPSGACPECAWHRYPAWLSDELKALKEKEKEVYQWLLVYLFSSQLPGGANLESELSAVADRRGFSGPEWSQLRQDAAALASMSFPVADQQAALLVKLAAWVTTGSPALDQIITDIPLAVIKGSEPGEPTLLLPQGSNEPKNFLVKSPYQLLSNYLCDKAIEPSFEQKYPKYTLQNLWLAFRSELAGALPYSIETVKTVTIAEIFKAIATTNLISNDDNDLREAYLFCKALDYTPAELLGLDQALVDYVRPEEYKILFDLVEYEMHASERPDGLNKLLEYLYTKTPVRTLADIRGSLPSRQSPDIYTFVLKTDINNFEGLVGTGLKRFSELSEQNRNILRQEFESQGAWFPPADAFLKVFSLDSRPRVQVFRPETPDNPVEVEVLAVLGQRYYLTYAAQPSGVDIYYNPTALEDMLGDIIIFLNTKISSQLNQGAMKERIIDRICKHPEMQVVVTNPQTNQSWEVSLCKWRYKREDTAALPAFFSNILTKTPLALLKDYFKEPLGWGLKGISEFTVMDRLSENSILGERYLDTLGRLTPLGDWLMWGQEAQAKLDGWVEEGIDQGVGAIQTSLEKALVEWPKQAASAIAKKLGFKMGEKAAEQIAGSCYEPQAGDDCKEGEVKRERAGAIECCILAKGLVCKPRCRLCGDTQLEQCEEGDCQQILGEAIEDVSVAGGIFSSQCCYNVADDKYCLKQRKINPQMGQCRETDDPRTTEDKKEVTIGGKTYTVCQWKEDLNETPGPASEDVCCATVSECIMNKLAAHLEQLADMLADGEIPVSCLTEKCRR